MQNILPANVELYPLASTSLSYHIVGGDLTANDDLRQSFLLSMVQEAATQDAAKAGYGYDELRRLNLAWACIQYYIKLEKPFHKDQDVKVKTWCGSVRHGLYTRSFAVFDEAGAAMVRINSTWTIINLETREMADPPAMGFPEYKITSEYLHPDLKCFGKLCNRGDFCREMRLKPQYSDLDQNLHVNNTHYADWLENILGYDWHCNNVITELSIRYQKEIRENNTVDTALYLTDDSFYYIGREAEQRFFEMQGHYSHR